VTPVRLPDGRRLQAAPLICYDAVVPELAIEAVRAGAELLVTLSNDAWFATGEGPHLHLVVSAFRSLETRTSQVRATNTGISAILSPTGELLAQAGVHQRAAIVAAVPPPARSGTLMLIWGDWFCPTALVSGILLLGATRWSSRK
jgi:apolipoprotein N-acyltransferase